MSSGATTFAQVVLGFGTLRTPAAGGEHRLPTRANASGATRQTAYIGRSGSCTDIVLHGELFGLFALRGRVPAAHRDEYPLTPDECAAIAESAETWCRRWSAWQSDSIADVARLMATRLCGSAPTFVRRGRACELQRHGQVVAARAAGTGAGAA